MGILKQKNLLERDFDLGSGSHGLEIGGGSELKRRFAFESHSDFNAVGNFTSQFDLLSQSRDVGLDLVGFQRDTLHALSQSLHQVSDFGD